MGNKLDDEKYILMKKFVLSRMKKITDKSHNDSHVLRVKNNALKIIRILDVEKDVDRNLIKIICLLHDFTYTVRKPSAITYLFEGHFERRLIRKVLLRFDLPEGVVNVIEEAVYRHTHSIPFRRLNKGGDVYTKILQDADSLDYFNKLRVKIYQKGKGPKSFEKIRKALSDKYVDYGRSNLSTFLNYPELAKKFSFD